MPPIEPTRAKLLVTGPPGCGKTTVIRRVIERMRGRRLAGFLTEDIREQGRRVGFTATGLGGSSTVLAHVEFRARHRVGRYGVDLDGFEAIVRAELAKPEGEVDLFVIDEIGKMECLSDVFVEAATRVLDSPVPVLATIAAKGGGFIGRVRARPEVKLVAVSPENRDRLPDEIARALSRG